MYMYTLEIVLRILYILGFVLFVHVLMSLKNIAAEEGIVEQLGIFQDPIYADSSTWTLSTSNVTTPGVIKIFGFGAVCDRGYGLGYQILNDLDKLQFLSPTNVSRISAKKYTCT